MVKKIEILFEKYFDHMANCFYEENIDIKPKDIFLLILLPFIYVFYVIYIVIVGIFNLLKSCVLDSIFIDEVDKDEK